MKTDDKKDLYSRYITTHFGKIHPGNGEYFTHYPYFRKNYLKHLPADRNAKIVDLGCGMGHFLSFLAKEGYTNYRGIDVSGENIGFCRKNNLQVEQRDIFDFLQETHEPFDAIIMNDILEHLEKSEIILLLQHINNALQHGGRLIIKAPNAANPIMASSSRYADFTHELLFTEESLAQVLRISGFSQTEIYPQDLYVFYRNPVNYLAKACNFFFNAVFRTLFWFYGRKTTKIFTKNIIAVAIRD